MYTKNKIKDNCLIISIIILMISFTANIYQVIVNKRCIDELRKQNYSEIEEIRYRNESILSILDSCITAGSVNNEELLTLYKNYSKITESEATLWNNYLGENSNLFLKNSKKISISAETTKNELYWQIEELIYSYIQNDMTAKLEVMELKEKSLENFERLKSMSEDLNEYFNNFYKKNCDTDDVDKKSQVIINNNYWVDILKGIQEIKNKYIDYSFTY